MKEEDPKTTIKRLQDRIRFLEEKERRFVAAGDARFLTRIGDALAYNPKVEWCLVQQTESMAEERTVPAPGAPGVWQKKDARRTEFRVLVRTQHGKLCDRTRPTLAEAVNEVLNELGIEYLPAELFSDRPNKQAA